MQHRHKTAEHELLLNAAITLNIDEGSDEPGLPFDLGSLQKALFTQQFTDTLRRIHAQEGPYAACIGEDLHGGYSTPVLGHHEVRLLTLALSRNGNLEGTDVPPELQDRACLRQGAVERLHQLSALEAQQAELKATITHNVRQQWSLSRMIVSALLDSGALASPAPNFGLLRTEPEQPGQAATWTAGGIRSGTIQIWRKGGITAARVTYNVEDYYGFPDRLSQPGALVVSDQRDRKGMHNLGELLLGAGGATPDISALPAGLLMWYHGPVGERQAFTHDAERLVVLGPQARQRVITSAISGVQITADDTVCRLLSL